MSDTNATPYMTGLAGLIFPQCLPGVEVQKTVSLDEINSYLETIVGERVAVTKDPNDGSFIYKYEGEEHARPPRVGAMLVSYGDKKFGAEIDGEIGASAVRTFQLVESQSGWGGPPWSAEVQCDRWGCIRFHIVGGFDLEVWSADSAELLTAEAKRLDSEAAETQERAREIVEITEQHARAEAVAAV